MNKLKKWITMVAEVVMAVSAVMASLGRLKGYFAIQPSLLGYITK